MKRNLKKSVKWACVYYQPRVYFNYVSLQMGPQLTADERRHLMFIENGMTYVVCLAICHFNSFGGTKASDLMQRFAPEIGAFVESHISDFGVIESRNFENVACALTTGAYLYLRRSEPTFLI